MKILRERLHFKAVIIDDEILYVGSINPLSVMMVTYLPEDYMLRFVSEALTAEVIDKAVGKDDFERYTAFNSLGVSIYYLIIDPKYDVISLHTPSLGLKNGCSQSREK